MERRQTDSSEDWGQVASIAVGLVVFAISLVAFTWTIGFGLYVLVFGDDHSHQLWVAIFPGIVLAATAAYFFRRLLHKGVLKAFAVVLVGILLANVLIYMLAIIVDEAF